MTSITQPSLSLPGGMPFLPDSDYSSFSGRAPATGVGHAPTAGHANGAGKSPEAVGKGFEEIFASVLIKHMRQAGGENGMFGHDPGDVLGGMFDHFMSQHMAQNGSLGISKMIQKHLANRSEQS